VNSFYYLKEELRMIRYTVGIFNTASIVLLSSMLFTASALADAQQGTAEQAQALVANVIAYYDANGQEETFVVIEDKEGEFVDRDLYIFVYGQDRTVVAHGADASLKGTQVDTLIDIHGKPFGTALMDGATPEGVWIEYTWYNPVTRELHPKSSWVVRHDGNVFGAGIYLQEEEVLETTSADE
jgi:signal transduction histidine kinase